MAPCGTVVLRFRVKAKRSTKVGKALVSSDAIAEEARFSKVAKCCRWKRSNISCIWDSWYIKTSLDGAVVASCAGCVDFNVDFADFSTQFHL